MELKENNFTRQHLTPVNSIRLKCIECMGGQRHLIKTCSEISCPLYPYRMGKRPKDSTTIKGIHKGVEILKNNGMV